ncbi:carbohydrate ABC transporter membrane protein 1, CUT1 family [Micromonospora viridifaciens]|uniref:Carbohydrate ABC transporter membrane protein 1, CUT1 family n=1 Tax=Micromonospora viridifaciens TaxID=1881 RepID=A0A1C4Y322_MICVI|nr:sugar ABC transporter permease [Micromonospora viridifaciens]SCF15127.1 carbohydrate ABC transporter membrane protein 1, CUT1 family [Micromonospora viridifaciens]
MASATAQRPVRAGGRRGATARRREGVAGWGFALPFLLVFAVFMAGPVLASFAMSLTDLRSADLRDPLGVDPVGLDNYVRLLGDDTFRQAAVNTAYFVLVGIPLTMVLGLAAAVGLDAGITRFRTFFRVGYYLPVVTSIVAIAVVWRFLLEPDSGLVNTLLGYVGIDGPSWLTDPTTAMPALIVMAAWRNMGYLMVIFLAGLQAIPRELYEAAAIDGSGAWSRFRHVTVPLMRPTLLFGGVITGIGYLQFFEEPFVMTKGGPLDTTLSVAFYIYNQFGFGNYSYAAAISYVLFLAILVLTLVQFRLLRSKT